MLPILDPWQTCVVAADVSVVTRASDEALWRLRASRLASLFSAAAAGSARYRQVFGGREPAAAKLEDLPIAHKKELMRDFKSWVADPALELGSLRDFVADSANIAKPWLGRYMVWESSGSTGESGLFVQDAAAMAVYDALEAVRRPVLRPLQRWLDPWGLTERIAFVGATGGHFASTVSVERLRRLQPGLSDRLCSFSFLQPIDALVAQLNAFRPTVLATYPSAAVLLAQERRCGRLKVSLQEIWTGGEGFSRTRRAFVGKAFECPVANSYGASEFLSLAFECSFGVLHLNSDWAILEPVDAHGMPVPAGRAGTTTLLTNLANHVQPLIRYDLGDRVTLLSPRCACGSRLPAIEVDGREDDTLVFRGARGTPPVKIVPLAVSTVLEEEAGLFDFQLLQRGPVELLLRTSRSGPETQAALKKAGRMLEDFLAARGADGVRIRCHVGESGCCGPSGKMKRVISSQR
ncbi:phenylacetate--CoA ligase family protein [Variovorax sp. EBFNA2]|uniref:phenylacetate--CoA ligase family protein n=1 Tax=Variovorax sp. EBFNA2 TaxID=3342097 RepID=UPI0029C01DA7|nr:phenylacetate--CoA ligase family protein [Variovorax boronicumulans]WPG40901.1 phenylacetate--CoA ligase family protein [Variovorax boronicumulans]